MYLYYQDFTYRMHMQSTLLFKHLGIYACISQPLDKPIGTTPFRGRNLNLSAKLRRGDVESTYLYYQDFTYRMHMQSTLYACISQPLDKPVPKTCNYFVEVDIYT